MQIIYCSDSGIYQKRLQGSDPFQLARPCWIFHPIPRDYVIPSFPVETELQRFPTSAGHPAHGESIFRRGNDFRRRA
jgi:hypothetical protein